MFRNRLLSTAALAVLGFGLIAAPVAAAGWGGAKGGGDRGARMFERYDTDGDGKISREEFEQARAARFATADADGDGAVTVQEFMTYAEARRVERLTSMFEQLDTDDDGVLSAEELDRRADAMFTRLDRDGDGVVTKEDLPQRGAKRGERGPMRGDQGPGPGPAR